MSRINDVLEAQEKEPMHDDAEEATEDMLGAMALMLPRERLIVFDVLSDFFCSRCGIEQPPGDCQCGAEAKR